MGRGRQKAKNTKVARELKYFSPNTDLNALEREIGTTNNEEPEYEDKWADLYEDDAEVTPTEEATTANEPGGSDPAESSSSDSGSSSAD
jgi:fructose/tagatose bisphosphate aldolase